MHRISRALLPLLLTVPAWVSASTAGPIGTVPTASPAGDPRLGAEAMVRERTPAAPADRRLPDLWASRDAELQRGLERLLAAQGLSSAAGSGHLAVVVADITEPAAPRVASVNGDHMMYAASLPKIAILLGAMDTLQHGRAVPDAAVEHDIEQMIRYSSNSAATRVLDWVGRDRLLALLQSPRLRLYDPAHNGGLWVGKDYGGSPAYSRDPLGNLSHGATAMQVARLFQLGLGPAGGIELGGMHALDPADAGHLTDEFDDALRVGQILEGTGHAPEILDQGQAGAVATAGIELDAGDRAAVKLDRSTAHLMQFTGRGKVAFHAQDHRAEGGRQQQKKQGGARMHDRRIRRRGARPRP